jgi:glycosyltransferase involved in cell wall biosynthesis
MRVAFVHLNRYQEIGSTDFFELSQAFGRMLPGSVHVIVARDGESQASLAGSVILHEIPVSTRRVWSRASISFYRCAASLLCTIQPDLAIVAFDRGAALIPLAVRQRLGKAAPKFVHHIYSVSFAANPLRYRMGNLLTKLESSAFDAVLTNTSAIAKEVYGVEFPLPVHIVSPGVNLEKFTFCPKARALHRSGFGDNELLFVYVGTLCAEKNADHIIEAFARANLGGDARLWMVGNGPMMGVLKAMVESRSIGNVYLLGRRDYDSIPGILSAADVAISHIERTSRFFLQPPIKVLEYLASGITVLASDVPGNRFYLEGCGPARFYDPSGVQPLAEALKSAVEAKRELNAPDLRAKARATVEAFSWDRLASKALASLMNQPSPAGSDTMNLQGTQPC